MRNASWFLRFSTRTSQIAGSSWTFMIAVGLVLVWALSGPVFDYSSDWQLAINTGTTIVTFLMVFLIQNTQNRDSVAMQLKLDELIRTSKSAHNYLLDIEKMSEAELERLRVAFGKLAKHTHQAESGAEGRGGR